MFDLTKIVVIRGLQDIERVKTSTMVGQIFVLLQILDPAQSMTWRREKRAGFF